MRTVSKEKGMNERRVLEGSKEKRRRGRRGDGHFLGLNPLEGGRHRHLYGSPNPEHRAFSACVLSYSGKLDMRSRHDEANLIYQIQKVMLQDRSIECCSFSLLSRVNLVLPQFCPQTIPIQHRTAILLLIDNKQQTQRYTSCQTNLLHQASSPSI